MEPTGCGLEEVTTLATDMTNRPAEERCVSVEDRMKNDGCPA